jgi:hypothetical protein
MIAPSSERAVCSKQAGYVSGTSSSCLWVRLATAAGMTRINRSSVRVLGADEPNA